MPIGRSENAQASARAADALSRDLGQLRQAYANTYKVDPVYADRAVGKVASFVGQTLPYVASYALGAPGIIFTTYFQCFQNNWDDAEESARRNGVRFDPDRAFNYAITVSTADAILSAIPAGRAASPWLKGKGGDIIRKNFLELLKKTSTEGTISAIQGGVQDAAAAHYKIDDRNPFDLQNRTFDFVVGGGTAAPFALTPQHPPTLRLDAENPPPRPPDGSRPPILPPTSQTKFPPIPKAPKLSPSQQREAPKATQSAGPDTPEIDLLTLKKATDIASIREPKDWHEVFQGSAIVKRSLVPPEVIFGVNPSDLFLTQIAGAPKHAIVLVEGTGTRNNGSISLRVIAPEISMHVSILSHTKGGEITLNIPFMKLQHRLVKGWGAHSFARTKQAAERIGIKNINLMAMGDISRIDEWNGYYVWATYGFDAPIPTEIVAILPPKLNYAKRISHLMLDPAGREFWKNKGGTTKLQFDLSPNSLSNRVFEDYKQRNDYNYREND